MPPTGMPIGVSCPAPSRVFRAAYVKQLTMSAYWRSSGTETNSARRQRSHGRGERSGARLRNPGLCELPVRWRRSGGPCYRCARGDANGTSPGAAGVPSTVSGSAAPSVPRTAYRRRRRIWSDEVDGLRSRHRGAIVWLSKSHEGEPSMEEITAIGLVIAKQVFQVHGVDAAGAAVVRRPAEIERRGGGLSPSMQRLSCDCAPAARPASSICGRGPSAWPALTVWRHNWARP